jgi:hypothetical protein
VGLGRLELPTSPLSGVRSNHLSYRPVPGRVSGGAGRDRTGDLLNANQALSQLSYSPFRKPAATGSRRRRLSLTLLEASWTRMFSSARLENNPLFSTRSGEPKMPTMNWNGCRLLHDSRFSAAPATFSLRKEVIQPQVLLRLPCYDFTPIMSHTLDRCPPCGLACGLLVQPTFVM